MIVIAIVLVVAMVIPVAIAVEYVLDGGCQAHDASREHWCELKRPTHCGVHVCSCGERWE